MTRWETNFYDENKDFIKAFAVFVVIAVAGLWLVCDHFRNEPIYDGTNTILDTIEVRVDSVEQRVDSLSKRVDKAEKTVERIGTTINAGRENAERIEAGIGSLETRLDSAIQRGGVIANIIEEIERSNRQRTQSASKTDMAK